MFSKELKEEIKDLTNKYIESKKECLKLEQKLEKEEKKSKRYKEALIELNYYFKNHKADKITDYIEKVMKRGF